MRLYILKYTNYFTKNSPSTRWLKSSINYHFDRYRNESRGNPASRAESSTSHVAFAVASRESDTASLSAAHPGNGRRRRLRRSAHVSEHTVHAIRPNSVHDPIPNATSHTASWSAYSQIRSTNAKSSSRTFRASAATFDDTRSSQIRSITQTSATLVHSLRQSNRLERGGWNVGTSKKQSSSLVSTSQCYFFVL